MTLQLPIGIVLFLIVTTSRYGLALAAVHDLGLMASSLRTGAIPDRPPFRGQLYASLGMIHCAAAFALVTLVGLHFSAGPLSPGAIVTYLVAGLAAGLLWPGLRGAVWMQRASFQLEFGASPSEKAEQLWGSSAAAAWPLPRLR